MPKTDEPKRDVAALDAATAVEGGSACSLSLRGVVVAGVGMGGLDRRCDFVVLRGWCVEPVEPGSQACGCSAGPRRMTCVTLPVR